MLLTFCMLGNFTCLLSSVDFMLFFSLLFNVLMQLLYVCLLLLFTFCCFLGVSFLNLTFEKIFRNPI